MAEEKRLTILPASWSAEIAQMLAPAADNIADIERQVTSGSASLFVAQTDCGTKLCAFVLRIDYLADGPEGVIVAAAGDGEGVNLTSTLLPTIETMFKGCRTRRIHTFRPGLAKLLVKEHGYHVKELVLGKEMQ